MFRATIILLQVSFWLLCVPVSAKMLEIKGKHPAVPQSHQDFHHDVSDRNVLGLDHSGKYGLPLQALSASQPKVLRILAIRVNFKKEEPDDQRTTGLGNFDMRTKEEFKAQEGHLIDPTPHNKAYFLKHLEALAEYYRVVSNGRVALTFDVYPRESDAGYQLDSSMAAYGLLRPEIGLGQLVFDALHVADADSALKLYDAASYEEMYDAYIIFHAGSDQQNNMIGFGNETPGDLYTGFVKMGLPFHLENGQVLVAEAVIMPETVSQDGRVSALNAVMAHEFGHQLGLVDLYDTRTFNTCVGDFSLMDDNGFGVNIALGVEIAPGDTVVVLVQGVLPVFPDAWSRAYLGFVDVVETTSANNIRVFAAERDTNTNQVLMVPINADEYFLIENRREDIDGDVATLWADSLSDVIMWPRSSSSSANNREYDFLIPGTGMLIWHVDESVARLDYDGNGISNFEDNKLQWYNFPDDPAGKWDNHHQFLALMEADGIVDFGRSYFSGYGSQGDFFEINSNSQFGPNTNPPSIANNNAYTGITIDDISAALLTMTCDIKVDGRLRGWPNQIFADPLPLTVADLDGDGKDEILTAAGWLILAYKFDGTSLFHPYPGTEIVVARDVLYGSGIALDTLAVFGRTLQTQRFARGLAVGDLNGDGHGEVVGVTTGGAVACFTSATPNYDGEASKLFEVSMDGQPATAPIVLDYDRAVDGLEILVYNEHGDKLVFDKNGNRILKENGVRPFRVMSDSLHTFELLSSTEEVSEDDTAFFITGAAAADFDRDGHYETAEVYFLGRLKINYFDKPLTVNVGGPIGSEISLGDIDNDGYVEILFCGDNRIYAYNHNGTPVSDFPIIVNAAIPSGLIRNNPMLMDIDGDDKLEIFAATSNGEIMGFNLHGERLDKFPKAVGGSVETPVIVASSDTTSGLFAVTRGGEISAFVAPVPSRVEWNAIYGSPRNFGSYVRSLPTPAPIAEAIGYLYNYPNPAGDRTTIRFSVRESGDVTLKLYNVAGDKVYDRRMIASAGADTEAPFDCSQLASGVYFCQLETQAGERKHCTIAVVR